MKSALKEQAIALRKTGKTYREILSTIPVAKSTLSEWLRSVGLAVAQQQRITQKRLDAAARGARARRVKRLQELEKMVSDGVVAVKSLSSRELWLIGTALYWAEGAKQNERSPSCRIAFGNMDVRMLIVFLHWLRLLGIKEEQIEYELYVHTNRKDETEEFKKWWVTHLSIPRNTLHRVYYKRGNPKTKRTNVSDLYHGLLRIKVKASTSLNRKVSGWTSGIVAAVGGGVTGNTSAFEAEDSRIVP